MGWVTLTLRKKELKVEHSYYQLRALQISREKRALARQKQLSSTEINNQQSQELASIKESIYNAAYDDYYNTTEANKQAAEANGETVDNSEAQTELNRAIMEYQTQADAIKSMYESELAMVEEEANDQETQLDVEQVDAETQMEAISEEMSAVSDAISTEIQNSTIKLS